MTVNAMILLQIRAVKVIALTNDEEKTNARESERTLSGK